jgi:major membrane immunogen (membrane-anchored lipoprotein)
MAKVSGKIVGANTDYRTNKPTITFQINEKHDFEMIVDDLKDCEKLSIEVKQYREKRSLDANAYFFVLADKLAEKLNTTKVEIYRNAIKEIGGVSEVVCVKNQAVQRLCEGWSQNGLGWQTDTFPSKIEGCTNVILYYGSSTYTTEQMSKLIENIVQDCKAVGIETRTPNEIANLLSMWGES